MEVNLTLKQKILSAAGLALGIGLAFYYYYKNKPAPPILETPNSSMTDLTKVQVLHFFTQFKQTYADRLDHISEIHAANRRKLYGLNEARYREEITRYTRLCESLVDDVTNEVFAEMGIVQELFERSLEALMSDPDVAREISDMHWSMARLLSLDPRIVPKEFTENVFASKLRDTVEILEAKIKTNPLRNGLDIAVLQSEISDELYSKYPYSDKIDRSATLKYKNSTNPGIQKDMATLNNLMRIQSPIK